jgi:hypothetical protein
VAVPRHDGLADIVAEQLNLGRYRGLRLAEKTGRPRQAAGARDGRQGQQMFGLHGHD